MGNIEVERYADSRSWQGNIQPADRSWIAFIDRQGRPVFFLNRDPATGAVID